MVKNFKLKIELGNDAMQTPEDVAEALEGVASRLKNTGRREGAIFDTNGNKVGAYEFQ